MIRRSTPRHKPAGRMLCSIVRRGRRAVGALRNPARGVCGMMVSMPATDSSPRLFIALWPGSAAQAATLAWQSAQPWPAGSAPVPSRNLHVTLHFLGPVAASAQAALVPALDRVNVRRMQIDFDRLELWNDDIAVLTASTLPSALSDLHSELADTLRSLGLPVEDRPFRPHVTLARRAAGLAVAERAPARWIASRFALVVSRGGQYRDLATFGARP